jgi:hypothetical protein
VETGLRRSSFWASSGPPEHFIKRIPVDLESPEPLRTDVEPVGKLAEGPENVADNQAYERHNSPLPDRITKVPFSGGLIPQQGGYLSIDGDIVKWTYGVRHGGVMDEKPTLRPACQRVR